MRSIPEARAVFSVVVNPTLTVPEFLRSCVAGFGLDVGDCAKDVLLAKLQKFLVQVLRDNKVAVLIVDEAHRLSTELLEEVRLLTNLETDKDKLIQVIFAGQDELADLLDRHDLRQLKQRITTRVEITPLSAEAVAAYIQHRWSRSSATPSPFDPSAVAAIRDASGGIPRLINSICENALLLGFAQGQRTIDASVISCVAADLHLAYVPNGNVTQNMHSGRQINQLVEHTVPLPKVVSAQAAGTATIERDAPRRGWRVLFGRR